MSPKIMTDNSQVKHIHVPRAAKACLACRRQKTRCFPSPDSLSCLRCQSLSRPCSFIKDGELEGNQSNQINNLNGKKRSYPYDSEPNILELDQNVKKILSMLQSKKSANRFDHYETITASGVPKNQPQSPNSLATSPFMLISKSVSQESTPLSIRQIFNPPQSNTFTSSNILSLKIISMNEAVNLVDKFKECYGRWISLPNYISTAALVQQLQTTCPILLTSICLTSLRYQNSSHHDQYIYKSLIVQLEKELHGLFMQPINETDTLKALVILSVYGYSLSTEEFIMDPWFISGLAVQKFLIFDINSNLLNLEPLNENLDLDEEFAKLSNFRIWNHICLVHLVNCCFSSRMCMLDEIRLDQARKSLDLSQATNFDGRIISEISLQLLLYNYLQNHDNDSFKIFEIDLKVWYDQWNYLFKQPTLQFVEFGYNYVYVVALYNFHFHGKSLDQEIFIDNDIIDLSSEILAKFMFHCIQLIDHINGIKDDLYFLCLSDQVHLCTFYITLLFIKLISYDKELTQQEIANLMNKTKLIKEKFQGISKVPNDLAGKVSLGIQEAINAQEQ